MKEYTLLCMSGFKLKIYLIKTSGSYQIPVQHQRMSGPESPEEEKEAAEKGWVGQA